MKTRYATRLVLALLLASCTLSAAQKKSKPNPPYALARGFANLMFGWCEIPRGIIYENARIPIVGFAVGPVKGGFLAIWRELAGAVDVLAMGLTREGLYFSQVPDFVWDAEWIPPCGEDIVSVENLTFDPCAAPPKSKYRPRHPRRRETLLRGRRPHHAKPPRREWTHHLVVVNINTVTLTRCSAPLPQGGAKRRCQPIDDERQRGGGAHNTPPERVEALLALCGVGAPSTCPQARTLPRRLAQHQNSRNQRHRIYVHDHLAPRHGAPPDGRPRRKPDREARPGPRHSQTNPIQDTKSAPFNLGPEGDCGDRLKNMELQISALERRAAVLR